MTVFRQHLPEKWEGSLQTLELRKLPTQWELGAVLSHGAMATQPCCFSTTYTVSAALFSTCCEGNIHPSLGLGLGSSVPEPGWRYLFPQHPQHTHSACRMFRQIHSGQESQSGKAFVCRALQNSRGPGRVLSQQTLAKSGMVDRWARTRHTGPADGKKPMGWGSFVLWRPRQLKKGRTFSDGGGLTHF